MNKTKKKIIKDKKNMKYYFNYIKKLFFFNIILYYKNKDFISFTKVLFYNFPLFK